MGLGLGLGFWFGSGLALGLGLGLGLGFEFGCQAADLVSRDASSEARKPSRPPCFLALVAG